MTITKVNLSCFIQSLVTNTADASERAPNATLNVSLIDELANGTGTDSANQVYYDTQIVGAGLTVTYDLAGSLEDVFGDTINTASRMETMSDPMRINISETTWRLVKDAFSFVERHECLRPIEERRFVRLRESPRRRIKVDDLKRGIARGGRCRVIACRFASGNDHGEDEDHR